MNHVSGPVPDPPEFRTCESCKGTKIEQPPISECCGARFAVAFSDDGIDWPDTDICRDCKEHAGAAECEDCFGEGEIEIDPIEEKSNQLDNAGERKYEQEAGK